MPPSSPPTRSPPSSAPASLPLSPRNRTISLAHSESASSTAPRVSSPLKNPAASGSLLDHDHKGHNDLATGDDEEVTFSPSSESSSDEDEQNAFPTFEYTARGQGPSALKHGHTHRRGSSSSPSITIDDQTQSQTSTTRGGELIPVASTRSLPTALASDLTITESNRGRTLAPEKPKTRDPSPAPSATTLDASWWGEQEHNKKGTYLPWKEELPKRKLSIPAAQLQGLEHTKQRVALAVRSVLGNVADVTYELLSVGVELLDLAPIPGLAPAAKTLLTIWASVQNVDVNFYGCLRLTERCADILISIRQELHEAGDEVGHELSAPIAKLEETFQGVFLFMQKQVRRPFLKRYLKRGEIQADLKLCNDGLNEALGLFGLSIQIRTLKQVQETARKQREEMQNMINAMIAGGLITASGSSVLQIEDGHQESPIASTNTSAPPALRQQKSSETVTRFITTANALGLVDSSTSDPLLSPLDDSIPHTDVLATLTGLQQNQNSLDSTRDFTEIRALMRRAIQAPNDAEMLAVLQVNDEGMPEAIKTLQRALEKVAERSKQPGINEEAVLPPGIVIGTVKRSVSVKEEKAKGKEGLKRSRTTISIESSTGSLSTASSSSLKGSGGGSSSGSSGRKRDTLDQEFIETGISALMRMSRGRDNNLPSWTITKYEVNRERQIGVGGFSKVYKGTWNGKIVAIKVLKLKVSRRVFVREVEIWKGLHHRNVLELCGASSAAGEPPWFLVSAYLKYGSLVDYLKRVEGELREAWLGNVKAQTRSRSKSPSPSMASGGSSSSGHGAKIGGRTATIPSFPLPGFKSKPDLPVPIRESSLPLPVQSRAEGGFEVRKQWDFFRFMLEIAEGMVYLHSKGVLHGDLKASNVLVDDTFTCVISDFGQSEIKSEMARLSGETIPHQGTLRWQAPEILTEEVEMTKETDVYAFAICCVEIVNLGKVPWGIMLEDEAIRQRVLKDNARPALAESPFNTPSLQEILKLAWHRDPAHRPQFSKIARDLELLQKNFNKGHESPKRTGTRPLPALIEDERGSPASPSPDMMPRPLPPMSPVGTPGGIDILQWDRSQPHIEATVATSDIRMPEPVTWTSNKGHKSNAKRGSLDPEDTDEDFDVLDLDDDAESLAPTDERVLEMKNELRYRLLLNHTFHPSLIMPLWTPSPDVVLGAVGFLSKPTGKFVTLFNAFQPQKSTDPQVQGLPSIHGYGKVTDGNQKQEKLNILQRGVDSVVGWISRNKNDGNVPIRRRYTFDLRAGHKAAHLCTESTEYRYMDKLDAPKKWFARNIDTIMKIFGKEHHLQREDLVLVVGLLRTPNYGLFVSHSHPDGHAHFNVYASPKPGQPWGTFTTDSQSLRETGPSYDETNDSRARLEASKVSIHGGSWDTVLIARLRFKPDATEPTAK
ncbi:TKL/TKL-ccin protein kinase [Ephemerocybe angulata]|uniref:TKL/TKL-ccin protein kinase n=1 Tax=Ephemerocybe angulata TaxID=980116 RepID=A0A8H6I2F8_9AGAR|nr:TKL/TKL-ccin protein kinase [Tulosesus angulatus]